ncbi:hypothetical protein KP509_02G059300 [Ceratopteris richardii]|uniref:Auxin-responsive protein n=1 Tax=Ceratopteris richardii TaxID=49495 RepID=A0A8T2VDF8_CERRI|nr:hypothetical protein KP509_02G059300 [Ceratopteris richardii]
MTMSCSVYASGRPASPPGISLFFKNTLEAVCPDLGFSCPEMKRNYLSIGLAAMEEDCHDTKEKSTSLPLPSPSALLPSTLAIAVARPASLPSVTAHDGGTSFGHDNINSPALKKVRQMPTSLSLGVAENEDHDVLCGSHLKLGPPFSSPDDENATDQETLSGNVGWPPISSYRKSTSRSLSYSMASCHSRDTVEAPFIVMPDVLPTDIDEMIDKSYEGMKSSTIKSAFTNDHLFKLRKPSHVKVSMDGTPIMRKIDLESMEGYQQLSIEIHKLFKFYKSDLFCEVGTNSRQSDFDTGPNFVLTYEAKNGGWMFVGDTPWCIFFQSARRLHIMRKGA